MSYSHSHKPDLPITHSSPLSTWLSVLFFFLQRQNHTVWVGLWVLLVVAVTLPSQLPYPRHRLLYLLLLPKKIGNARPGEGD